MREYMKNLSVVMLFSVLVLFAGNASAERDRSELPGFINNSYLGVSFGMGSYGFGNDELKGSHEVREVSNKLTSGSVYSGHNFNEHLAFNLGYIRPLEWIKYEGLDNTDSSGTVRITLFTFTLRPTLKINSKLSVNGQGGLGYMSRSGIEQGGDTFIEDGEILTLVTGAGLSYQLANSWYADADIIYSLPRESENQPGLLYTSFGIRYLLKQQPDKKKFADETPSKKSHFPYRLIAVGGFTRDLFYWEPHEYFHPPNIPIFWIGDVKLNKGYYIMYEHNLYHTSRLFSFDWGARIAYWESNEQKENFSTYSLYLSFKIWLVRNKIFDLYVTYSAAGPTYISKPIIDNIDTGKHFTFQDFMGIGVFLGKNKRININSTIMHYSNGNIFPQNTGIAVPSTLAVGYSF
jgi:opacity protein-like surface antigen